MRYQQSYRTVVSILFLVILISCGGDKVVIDNSGNVNLRAQANALAFDNIQFMANIQSTKHPDALLFSLSGGVGLDGRVAPGENWSFHYYHKTTYFDDWYVFRDGSIEYGGHSPIRTFDYTSSIQMHLQVNSDRIVQVCLNNGAADYLKKFQPQQIYIDYKYQEQGMFPDLSQPVCKVQFYHPSCTITFLIHPTSGALINKDLSCLSNL